MENPLKTVAESLARRACVGLVAWATLTAGCSKQSTIQRHLQRGNQYYSQGEFEKARIEYLNVIRLDRTNQTAVAQLGRVFHQQGGVLRAYSFLREAEKGATNDWDLILRLSSIRAAFGERDAARGGMARVLEHWPTNDEAILMLAELSDTAPQAADARQRLAAARRSGGERASLHLAESLLLARERKNEEAEKAVQLALAMDPKLPAAHMAMFGVQLYRTNLAAADREFKMAADLSPPHSNIPIRYADFLAQQGRAVEARKYLEALGAKTPDYLPIWATLARVAYAEKRLDDAQQLVDRVLAGDPANYEAGVLRASIRIDQKKPDQAVSELTQLDRAFPRLPRTKLLLARAALADKKLDQAMGYVDQALLLDPNHVEASLFKAQLIMAQGDAGAAIRLLQSIVAKTNLVPAQILLGQALRQGEQWDSAGAVFQGLIGAFPKDPQYPFRLGLLYREAGRNSEARTAFENVLKLSPDNPLAIHQLVELDLAATNYSAALDRVRSGMGRHPEVSVFHVLEGRILAQQKLWPQAEASLLKALTLNTNSAPACELLAEVYIAAGEAGKAAGILERQLASHPENQRALFTVALVYERLQDYPKAQAAYEKCLQLYPTNVVTLNNLAYLYLARLDQPDKAVELARKARALAPRDPAIADTLGWALCRKRDYGGAVPLLQESADMLPGNAEVQYHLGMAHYMRGTEDAARMALTMAVNSPAEFQGKDEARSRLASLGAGADAASPAQIAELEKIVAQRPDDLIAINRLAAAYRQTGRNDRAAEFYEKALKLNPRAVATMIQLAEVYAGSLRQPARALQLAKEARALAPEDVRLGALAGHLAFEAGEHAWAYSLLYESAARQPADADAQFDLAWAAYSLGHLAEAGQKMQRALELNPSMTRATAGKWFLALLAQYTNSAAALQAEAGVRQLLAAEPGNVPALMVTAALAEGRGAFAEARDSYERALQRYPLLAPAQRDLAALYAERLNDPIKAASLAGKARQTLGADAKLIRVQGKAALDNGDPAAAVRYLEECVQLASGDATAFYYLGLAHARLQHKPAAAAALQKALALAPNAPFAAEAQRLQREMR